MKIIENYDPEGVVIESLEFGDMFVYSGSYFMKCQNSGRLTPSKQGFCIGVNLADGDLHWIEDTLKVVPIYGRIRINGRSD